MAEKEQYDVVVLGGGTAGSNAAHAAYSLGKRVAMVFDESTWQNLCIELGCMPSKSLLDGVHLGLSYEEALARKDEHIKRFLSSLQSSQESIGYDIVKGHATFNEERNLVVRSSDGERILSGARYVIATGSENFVPPIPGLDDAPHFTSDDVMRNNVKELPKRLAVIGGGPIGLELATFFAGVGSEVTVLERGTLLSPFDPEFGVEMKEALTKKGMTIMESASVERISSNGGEVSLFIKTGDGEKELVVDNILVATGRRPKTGGLGLEHLGLQCEKGSLLECDATLCTENEDVYAAGDVTRDIELLHVASEEGRVAGHNAAGGEPVQEVDHDSLRVFVVFSDPVVAHIGMAEKDAVEKGIEVVSVTTKLPETGRAITMGVEYGLWKMIADKKTGEIIGSTLLGPRADDLIHEVYLVKKFGKTVPELAEMASHFGGYHPTLSEQFFVLLKKLGEEYSK